MDIIVLFISLFFSFTTALNLEQLKSLAPPEVAKIKLRSKLVDGPVDPEKELGLLDILKQSVKWLGTQESEFEAAGLSESTLKSIEAEQREIETYKEILKDLKELKSTEKSYFESLEPKADEIISKSDKNWDQHEVSSVKKLFIACKYFGKNVLSDGVCATFAEKDADTLRSELTSEAPTAIKTLQKADNGLLLTLAERVKRLKSKEREESEIVSKAQAEMGEILRKALEDLKGNEATEEVNQRLRLVELFLKPESNAAKMTISSYDLRLKAFEKTINTLIERLELGEMKLEEAEGVLKKWLLINQMMYAADWVTRSGRFVKPWPAGFAIERYDFPEMEDNGGYFGVKNVKVNEEKEAIRSGNTSTKTWKSRLTSISRSFKSFLGFGKKGDSEKDSFVVVSTTEGAKQGGLMSNIFGNSSEPGSNKTIVGRLTSMLPTSLRPKEDNSKGGFLSSIFSKKTAAVTPEESKKQPEAVEEEKKSIFNYFRSKSTKPTAVDEKKHTVVEQPPVVESKQSETAPSKQSETAPSKQSETATLKQSETATLKPTEVAISKQTEAAAPPVNKGGYFSSFFSKPAESAPLSTPEKKKSGLFGLW